MSFYAKPANTGKTTKKKAEQIHAKKRALDRFDIVLTHELRAAIIYKIKHDQTLVVEREQRSLRTTIHLMTVLDQLVLVVYDKRRHEIVTLMKPKARHIKFAQKNKDKLQF